MKLLASPLVSSLVGGLLFLAVWTVMLLRGYRPPPPPPPVEEAIEGLPGVPPATTAPKNPPPSWSYFNPDVEYLVKELKEQRRALTAKESDLRELEARLASERSELSSVTQHVSRLQAEINATILRVKEDEQANMKRLAKMYSGMDPASAAKVLGALEVDISAKILFLMKDDQASAVLDALPKANAEGVKRAADITKRLRLMQSMTKK